MILNGDVLEMLKTLPDESVQCCVTSPPYWGLRDYGTAKWQGGDAQCTHAPDKSSPTSTLGGGKSTQGAAKFYRDVCGVCGAVRVDGQIGLEKTPEEYVAKMVEVFREVRRVLRSDGVLWLNLGDSYAGSGRGLNGDGTPSDRGDAKQGTNRGTTIGVFGETETGLKAKDLCGIPWRVAFALQADGWWLRQDIIWAKPNPMPESVTDRCTKSHEYIFLLTKSARYYYDAEAVAEPLSLLSVERLSQPTLDMQKGGDRVPGKSNGNMKAVCKNIKGDISERGVTRTTEGLNMKSAEEKCNGVNRNRRSVWSITTKPFSGAHFATFPPEIPEICIKAGSKEGDTILDPFAGSGTTLEVAERMGRKSIGIELNPKYVTELIEPRLANVAPLFSGR